MSHLINCELEQRALQGAPSRRGWPITSGRSFICVRFPPPRRKQHSTERRSFSCFFFSPLCALSFRNVIYGAWRNSFRFLGLRTTEFTTPDVLTSSFFPLTPRPTSSTSIHPGAGVLAYPSWRRKREQPKRARVYTYIRVRSR